MQIIPITRIKTTFSAPNRLLSSREQVGLCFQPASNNELPSCEYDRCREHFNLA